MTRGCAGPRLELDDLGALAHADWAALLAGHGLDDAVPAGAGPAAGGARRADGPAGGPRPRPGLGRAWPAGWPGCTAPRGSGRS